jgi:hypothetical protein
MTVNVADNVASLLKINKINPLININDAPLPSHNLCQIHIFLSTRKIADFLNIAVRVDDEAASKFARILLLQLFQMPDKKSTIPSMITWGLIIAMITFFLYRCLSKKDKAAVGRCQ